MVLRFSYVTADYLFASMSKGSSWASFRKRDAVEQRQDIYCGYVGQVRITIFPNGRYFRTF